MDIISVPWWNFFAVFNILVYMNLRYKEEKKAIEKNLPVGAINFTFLVPAQEMNG